MRFGAGPVAAALALLSLGACALPQSLESDAAFSSMAVPPDRRDSEIGEDEDAKNAAVYRDLVRGLLAQEQYYAALAHVQEQQRLGGERDELRLLEAEARRRLGQTDEAEKLYRGLLGSRYAGEAYHGLGLLYAERDLGRAVGHLQQAVQRRPTNAEARSDLGYGLMKQGRYVEALPQIATAVELDPASDKARNNLIILLMLTGDERGVRRVASEAQVPAAALARLRQQAQSLRGPPERQSTGAQGTASRGAR